MKTESGIKIGEIIEMICAYTEYLKNEHNLLVSIHFAQRYPYLCERAKALLKYNTHTNPYCFKVKSNRARHKKCIKCQEAVLKKCAAERCYTGVCHAGVAEYVHGFFCDGIPVGFVSVSGYKSDKKPYCTDDFYIRNIKDKEMPTELLNTVVPPLCMMLERFVGFKECENTYKDVYYDVLDFLRERHSDVSVDEIAKKFNFSKSYISHMFKKKSGRTLKEYCNILKINDAKVLLESSDMSVTEVAQMSGFNNFSYFIKVFKGMTGMTPLKWRAQCRDKAR